MATARLEIYNADGSLALSRGHRVFRVLKQVTTGTSDGSTSVPDIGQGMLLVRTGAAEGYKPQFSVDGTNVEWTFDGVDAGDRRSIDAMIGVY